MRSTLPSQALRSQPLASSVFQASRSIAPFVLFAWLGGCGGGADPEPAASLEESLELGESTSALSPTTESGCDPSASASAGFVSTSMPVSSGTFTITLRATPELDAMARPPTIDGVIGLSSGTAAALEDMGVAVRFTGGGDIEARNGTTFMADAPLPYAVGRGAYELRIDVDVPAHTYSVWARHLDAQQKPLVQIAKDYAFGDQQQAVTQLDTVNRVSMGARGAVTTCGFSYVSTSEGPIAPVMMPIRIADWRAVSSLLGRLDR